MNRFLILITVLLGSCFTNSNLKQNISSTNLEKDVRYLKKDNKEFLYLKGTSDNYTVVTNEQGLSLDLKDSNLAPKSTYINDSQYVEEVNVVPTEIGSRVDVSFKDDQGFKVYKRPSGLLLAMGPGYQEISDFDLEDLESEINTSSSIDDELDMLILEAKDYSHGGQQADKELDLILKEFESDVVAPEPTPVYVVKEEQKITESLQAPVEIKRIQYVSKEDKDQIVVETASPATYERKHSEDAYKQVVLDMPNTYIPTKIRKPLESKDSSSSVSSINPYQMDGQFKTARLLIHLNEDVKPNIQQKGNYLYISFPKNIYENYLEHDDVTAARYLTESNFHDYLAKPRKFYGSKVTIDIYDGEVIDALKMIKAVSGINIVASDSIKGEKVNISLKNVPWDQALSTILQSNKLAYLRQGSVIRVAKLEELRDERKLAVEAVEAGNDLEPLRVLVKKLNYLRAQNLENEMKTILSKRGKLSIESRTNSIIIHDIEESIVKANSLISRLDTQPIQIAIEANIVEASTSWLEKMGFAWSSDSGNIIFKSISNVADIDTVMLREKKNKDLKIISSPKIMALNNEEVVVIQGAQIGSRSSYQDIELALKILPTVADNGDITFEIDIKRDFVQKSDLKGTKKASSKLIMRSGDTAIIGGIYSLEDKNPTELIVFLKARIKNMSLARL